MHKKVKSLKDIFVPFTDIKDYLMGLINSTISYIQKSINPSFEIIIKSFHKITL